LYYEGLKRKPYIHTGNSEITEEEFKGIGNSILGKPYGGLWASPFIPDSPRISPWIDWCVLNDFNIENLSLGVAFTIAEGARWAFLHSDEDLEKLGEKTGFIRYTVEESSFISVNFEAAAEIYDVIYFSTGKVPKRRKKMNSKTKVSVEMWDCESIVVTNFSVIDKQIDLGHPLSYYFRDKAAQDGSCNEEIYQKKEAGRKRRKRVSVN
jgi:hypothetical protein